MTIIKQLALATATLVLILGLALASNALLDRYTLGEAACIDTRGSWVNWSWPNVPALSPPCSEQIPAGKNAPQTDGK